jgi:hypothetical protein
MEHATSRSRDAIEAIMRLAAAQHGVVGTDQLDDAVVRRGDLDNLVRRGVMRRVAPGVYAVAGSADTWERRLHTGLVALGPDAYVSHEAAARVHGLDRSIPNRVEFTVRRARRGVASPWPVHTTKHLGATDIVVVRTLPTSSATRTILDLARARVPRERLEAAIDSAVRLGLSSPIVIEERLSTLRGRGRWGCRLLDELLTDSGGHTMLERRFLAIVRRAGLPRPATQVVHRHGTRTIARVDFLFERLGVVVEVSGSHGHASPTERGIDAQRRNELQDIGRRVYEYTWHDVTRRALFVARTLTERLESAGWHR